MKQPLKFIFFFFSCLFFTEIKAQTLNGQLKKLSDAADNSSLQPSEFSNTISYEAVTKQWKNVAEVNQWIKANFSYSIERAKQLAENSSTREQTHIYTPAELYQLKKGVCIDLSRFAVETLNRIDTSKDVQYLMIEFEPIIIDSSIIRKHWLAAYQDTSGYYLFADSKRPGHLAGPYNSIDDFITEYQAFRGRTIVSRKLLPSYEKKKIKKMLQQKKA
ncbi:transglutaminase-like domain-containing protein [Runella sp.]|uniref:transglutaminase-like domain-containing protein n=1 Tax=Runella sp. TaxID=1960881 RepID=UPI003D12B1BD